MLVEPIPPSLGSPEPATNGPLAALRARTARDWLAHGLELAARPGMVDPTPALAGAFEQALAAITEAVDAHAHDVGALERLHLARDEVRLGLARLTDPAPDARTLAMRHARMADRALDDALAVIDPKYDLRDTEVIAHY